MLCRLHLICFFEMSCTRAGSNRPKPQHIPSKLPNYEYQLGIRIQTNFHSNFWRKQKVYTLDNLSRFDVDYPRASNGGFKQFANKIRLMDKVWYKETWLRSFLFLACVKCPSYWRSSNRFSTLHSWHIVSLFAILWRHFRNHARKVEICLWILLPSTLS